MRHHPLNVLLLSAALLTACGAATNQQASQAKPGHLSGQTLTAASGTTLHTYQANLVATTTLNTPGLPTQVIQTPTGLKTAYLFNGDQVKTRVDIPGGSFPDGRGRIALYDSANAAARIVFADTLAQDTSMDARQLVALLQPQVNIATPSTSQGMQTQSLGSFKSMMSAKGIPTTDTTVTINGVNTAVTQAKVTLNNPNGGTLQSTLNFDPQLGKVVQSNSTLTTSEAKQVTTTTFTFDQVSNLSGVTVPAHLHTTGNITTTSTGGTTAVTQDVDFQNAQINTLPDSYFSIGGL